MSVSYLTAYTVQMCYATRESKKVHNKYLLLRKVNVTNGYLYSSLQYK
jgi:hypothetical protein